MNFPLAAAAATTRWVTSIKKRPPPRKHASVPEGRDGSEDAPRGAQCDESENCRNQRWRRCTLSAATEQMSLAVISAHL